MGATAGGDEALVALLALGVLVPAARRLVPAGSFTARPGLAAVVAGRALIAGAFFTATAYLPLMLTSTHGWSLTAAGTPPDRGVAGWSAASAWQGGKPDLPRDRLLRLGFVGVAAGVAGLCSWRPPRGVPWLALPSLGLAGVGMGLGVSALSFLLLADSASADLGFNSSSANLADQLSQAVLVRPRRRAAGAERQYGCCLDRAGAASWWCWPCWALRSASGPPSTPPAEVLDHLSRGIGTKAASAQYVGSELRHAGGPASGGTS